MNPTNIKIFGSFFSPVIMYALCDQAGQLRVSTRCVEYAFVARPLICSQCCLRCDLHKPWRALDPEPLRLTCSPHLHQFTWNLYCGNPGFRMPHLTRWRFQLKRSSMTADHSYFHPSRGQSITRRALTGIMGHGPKVHGVKDITRPIPMVLQPNAVLTFCHTHCRS